MAEKDTGQERTEEPTPKRRADSREKGDIARSRELTTMMVLVGGVVGFYLSSTHFFSGLTEILINGFTPSRADIFDPLALQNATVAGGLGGLAALTPMLILLTIVAIFSPLAIGGWSFNPSASAFKWNRLDPISGLKKVFGPRGLIEMVKALAKFALILGFALTALYVRFDDVGRLGLSDINSALADSGAIVFQVFIFSVLATFIIAIIDVPYTLWEHTRKLRMTRQEIKDETKQQEGSPEMRGRVRGLQQEMANRRMMDEVPKADVVITNPEHYAVALQFDPDTMSAPLLVAKGADDIAFRIREIAVSAGVTVVAAPPLARSIYHTTKLNREIPAGLYMAVAQILAYVFQLRKAETRNTGKAFDDLPIPDDLQF